MIKKQSNDRFMAFLSCNVERCRVAPGGVFDMGVTLEK